MNGQAEAIYKRLENVFKKKYGTTHICGECIYTTKCARIKIQDLRVDKEKKYELMCKLAPFVTEFEIENHKPKNCDKILQFIKVYKCNNFVFDGGQ